MIGRSRSSRRGGGCGGRLIIAAVVALFSIITYFASSQELSLIHI